jgi:hypothetical protein
VNDDSASEGKEQGSKGAGANVDEDEDEDRDEDSSGEPPKIFEEGEEEYNVEPTQRGATGDHEDEEVSFEADDLQDTDSNDDDEEASRRSTGFFKDEASEAASQSDLEASSPERLTEDQKLEIAMQESKRDERKRRFREWERVEYENQGNSHRHTVLRGREGRGVEHQDRGIPHVHAQLHGGKRDDKDIFASSDDDEILQPCSMCHCFACVCHSRGGIYHQTSDFDDTFGKHLIYLQY